MCAKFCLQPQAAAIGSVLAGLVSSVGRIMTGRWGSYAGATNTVVFHRVGETPRRPTGKIGDGVNLNVQYKY